MLVELSRQDQDGNVSLGAVNPKFITSALWVRNLGLTAINMHNQPTIWVTNKPQEVSRVVHESEYNSGATYD